ncbi:MAG: T9SS type A sorting domain-containing protein, partial [Bacteroidales bacterium]|nr:T9SS type A sorting domain-containing protein [Bacteroidales bacterium]
AANVTVKANYIDVYNVSVESGTADKQQVSEGETVTVTAAEMEAKRFTNWTSEDNIEFADPAAATTTFTMPAANVTVKANYIDVYNVSVESGTADKQQAAEGETVTVTAAEREGELFYRWNSGDDILFDQPYNKTTTFVMPAKDIQVSATYEKLYTIEIEGGHADVSETTFGKIVNITADVPDGYIFSKWESSDVLFSDENSLETSFSMPSKNVMIKAIFISDVAIDDAEGNIGILYPNPAYDYVCLSGTAENIPVKIYSADGHLVITIEKYNGESVNITSLLPGTYYVKVENKTFPFIKK